MAALAGLLACSLARLLALCSLLAGRPAGQRPSSVIARSAGETKHEDNNYNWRPNTMALRAWPALIGRRRAHERQSLGRRQLAGGAAKGARNSMGARTASAQVGR